LALIGTGKCLDGDNVYENSKNNNMDKAVDAYSFDCKKYIFLKVWITN